ncbi:MAG: RNA polymerase sigma-70 factor [Bacteroidales bacterium]|nr:RNA polymerase sigma-70 factor [Bacteroidales bacterium]
MPLTETIAINITDKGHFKEVFTAYYESLCIFAYKYIREKEAAADIVQDAFVSLWNNRYNFNNLLQIRSYLYTCVKNSALNEIAHRNVVAKNGEAIKEMHSETNFHDSVVEVETFRIMRKEIDKLPQQMRNIMLLSLQGAKNAEIAEILQISINTVHTLKRLAYKKLRKNMSGHILIFIILLIKTL